MHHAVTVFFVLLVELLSLAQTAFAIPRPLTEHQTVHDFLENQGGHELVRRHLKLPNHVIYNPLLHLSVDHARERHSAADDKLLHDTTLLRKLGYYVPGIDKPTSLTSGDLHLRTTVRDSERHLVRGDKSIFEVSYRGSPPLEAKQTFAQALKTWADTFPCGTVHLRVLLNWEDLKGTRTLAAAVSPFSILRRDVRSKRLRSDAAYTPTMAAAVGEEDFIPDRFHIEITFNSQQPWHFYTDQVATRNYYDFATVAIHEICHGLFFTGALIARPQVQVAEFQSQDAYPGRFDQFIQMRNGVGIARSCNIHEMYQALTRRGLMFRTTTKDSTFMLYAPTEYRPGSSTYHLDSLGLQDDCRRQAISLEQCSDLMTFELDPGYTRRVIGIPTLRIMNSVMGKSQGLVKSSCDVPRPLRLADSPGTNPGILGGTTDIGPFKLQTWVVAVAAVVAALGAAIVVFFIVTAFARR